MRIRKFNVRIHQYYGWCFQKDSADNASSNWTKALVGNPVNAMEIDAQERSNSDGFGETLGKIWSDVYKVCEVKPVRTAVVTYVGTVHCSWR